MGLYPIGASPPRQLARRIQDRAHYKGPGLEIDLLIDRKDQVINLCEMKFSIHSFTIDKTYAEKLRNKLGSFKELTQTKKALFLTLITTYGITQNKYSGMVRNGLEMDVLFE